MAPNSPIHVGLCGAGLGGLVASIALARAGVRVTVLEAAPELGEIGAGIQMTPNISRYLLEWGVYDIIGDKLMEFTDLYVMKKDGSVLQHSKGKPDIQQSTGFPWWTVHRHHLHQGLVEVARRNGVRLLINSQVTEIDHSNPSNVHVRTELGAAYTFDLLIGSDGVGSTVRNQLFPGVKPAPPTGNCAYRAIVPLEKVAADPLTRPLVDKVAEHVWITEKAYIIAYQISAGSGYNVVMSHHRDHLVDSPQEVDMKEFREAYRGFDPKIVRVMDMITETLRWPLLTTEPLESWSSPQKNVVLIGDAAHAMTNHLAQGAATSMEDGVFLGQVMHYVVAGKLTIPEAVSIYEKARMPNVFHRQQISFMNGAVWQLPPGKLQEERDRQMSSSSKVNFFLSPPFLGNGVTLLNVYGYNAEADADLSVQAHLMKREPGRKHARLQLKTVKDGEQVGWYLEEESQAKL